jgi:hypothetical protein
MCAHQDDSAAVTDPAHAANAERSILRRWAKAASITAKTSARSTPAGNGGGSVRTSRTRPESTFGTGQKTERGTAPARSARAYQAVLTLGPPYALLPGGAASRSATSDCSNTRPCRIEGKSSNRCRSTGTATL